MARRHRAEKRGVIPDPKFNSDIVAKFTNHLMLDGKKSTAQRIVYDAFETIKEKLGEDPLMVFEQAINNARPQLEVKSRRVGGATYQVPLEVSEARSRSLAMRWMIDFSRKKKGVGMAIALAGELMDAYGRTGSAIKKRDDTHKMAQANRAFAHYRW